jgi:hypothetical protein
MDTLLGEKGSRPQTSSSAMSRSREHVERRCILWVHDEQFSKEEVVLNMNLLPEGTVKPGDLLAIVALKADTAGKEFQDKNLLAKKGTELLSASVQVDTSAAERKSLTGSISVDASQDIDLGKQYLFAVKDMSKELKAKHPTLEVSIAKHIADVFGFKNRSNVLLTTVCNDARVSTSKTDSLPRQTHQ